MASIRIENLKKSFGSTEVLNNINLEIEDGEFVSLVGPSGCGKSTLLKIIAGLETQTEGRVFLGDRCVDGVRPAMRDLSMVFQTYALYPHLTAAENIAVPLLMRNLKFYQRIPLIGRIAPGARQKQQAVASQVADAASMLNIQALLDRKPRQLSGGQMQRVALGRAMVRDPEAFLLDEPLSNLDASLRVQMRVELAQLHRKLARTFVYVTHDQIEAMTMSDRIAVMLDGELLQVASPMEVFDKPANLKVARFIGYPAINLLAGKLDSDGTVLISGWRTPLVSDSTTQGVTQGVTLGVRAEHVIRVFDSADRQDLWRGSVRHIELTGSDAHVEVELSKSADTLYYRCVPAEASLLSIGDSIDLTLDWEQVHLFNEQGIREATTRVVKSDYLATVNV